MWLGPNLLQFDLTAQMGSNQLHRFHEILSEAGLLRCWLHTVTSMPQPEGRFCDVTLLRIGQNNGFCAVARQRSTQFSTNANADEAPQFQEFRRHSRSSPPAASHTTKPIHTNTFS